MTDILLTKTPNRSHRLIEYQFLVTCFPFFGSLQAPSSQRRVVADKTKRQLALMINISVNYTDINWQRKKKIVA